MRLGQQRQVWSQGRITGHVIPFANPVGKHSPNKKTTCTTGGFYSEQRKNLPTDLH